VEIGLNLEFIRCEDKPFAAGLERAAQLGYRFVEPVVHNGRELLSEAGYFHSVSMEEEPLEIRELLDRYGLRASGLSAHCPLMRPAISVPYLQKPIRFAAAIGAPVINTDEGIRPAWLPLEEAFGVMRYTLTSALRVAERYRIYIGIEPHQSISCKTEGLLRIATLVDSEFLKVNYDTGNAYLAGEDPYAGLEAVAGRLVHVHAKDITVQHAEAERGEVTGTPVGCACGDGVIDWTRVAAILRGHGFEGVLSVECGTPQQAARSLAHLQEEYDELIEDPTRFLYDVWLPRVSTEVSARGQCTSYRNNLSFVKGGMAMLSYFSAFGSQLERLRTECGTVSAISGMLKAPLDIRGEKLRGYLGLAIDLKDVPEKVLAACQALMPHLAHVAISGLDPNRQIPIPIWMHRGCVPFISRDHFETIYWPTLKPVFEAIWARGNQVLMCAEGNWAALLERFAELPAGSIIYHIDRGDIAAAHKVLGRKFFLSGGIPNALLAYGTPEAVRAECRRVIDAVACDGGYIMDASPILQNDASVENVRAMTEFTREYGVYGLARSQGDTHGPGPAAAQNCDGKAASSLQPRRMAVKPGVCIPWEAKLKELPPISGNPELVGKIWEDIEAFAYLYIWHTLVG